MLLARLAILIGAISLEIASDIQKQKTKQAKLEFAKQQYIHIGSLSDEDAVNEFLSYYQCVNITQCYNSKDIMFLRRFTEEIESRRHLRPVVAKKLEEAGVKTIN